MSPTPSLEDLINAVVRESADDLPLTRLRTAAAMARSVSETTDAALGYFVDQARRAGHSWSEIGESLGVSKQAAQQRQSARAGIVMPPVTFERFTERARSVLTQSESVARDLAHDYIGTEHLLLAQFTEPAGLAAVVMTESGLSSNAVREAVIAEVGRGSGAPEGKLAFTPEAIAALSAALTWALELRHNYIGTEHMLFGVAKTESAGSRILRARGLDEAAVGAMLKDKLANVMALRAAHPAPAARSAPPAPPPSDVTPPAAGAPPAGRRARAPRSSPPGQSRS
jgi:hypothetical protein